MRIVHWGKAKAFIKRFPQARAPLNRWRRVVITQDWHHIAELRAAFSSADQVGEFTVFDIGGNNFRLIAIVVFGSNGRVYIRSVLTPEEYSEGKWRT